MLDQNAVFIFSVNNPDPGLHRNRDSYSGKTDQKESENYIKSHSELETGEKCVVALFFFS